MKARTYTDKDIIHGHATIVWCPANEAWALPGGKLTTNRYTAERWCRAMNIEMGGR